MRWLAGIVLLALAAGGSAEDAVDFHGMVRGPDGKPAIADVWLVTSKVAKPPYRIVAQTKSDANGQFQFGKELIDPLWKQSIYPQMVARDASGRIGSIYGLFLGTRNTDTLKLRDTGEVRGRILNADGEPIAGAKVEPIYFAKMHVDRQFAEPTYLPPEVVAAYMTQTDADGRFVVRGLPKGARLVADIRAERCAHVVIDWDTSTPLELRLPPPATLDGRLTGGPPSERGGRELTLVTANLVGPIGPRGALTIFRQDSVKSNADGSFRFENLPPGVFELRASDPKVGAFYHVDIATLEIKAKVAPSPLQLLLEPARKLRGQVMDDSGAGIPGVRVSLCRFINQGGPFGRQATEDSEAVSDPDGWYEGYVLPGGEPGAQIKSLPEGIGRKDSGQVMAAKDPAAMLPPLRIEKIVPLIVHVVDAHGKPVSGAEITASGEGWFFPHKPKPSGPDGVVRLLFADRSEDATLKVTAGDAVSEPLTIDPAQERGPLTMTVSPSNAFRFQGQVIDRVGNPLVGPEVAVMHMVSYRSKRQPGAAGSGFEDQRLTTDADGRFAAGPFIAGDQFSLTVRLDGYRNAGTANITASKGTTHDFGKIVLQRIDAVVRGRVVDSAGSPIAGAKVVNSGDAPTRLVTTSAADGSFELRGLTAGNVYVVAFKDDYLPAWLAVDTDKSETATLTLRKRGEPSSDLPPVGIDETAVRAAAKQVLEKLWDWPEARKSPADKKVIELMARLDPEQARRWSGKTTPDEPTIDQLVESDLDEALAQLSTMEKYAACREMKRLAQKLITKDRAKALRLAQEMAVQARSVDPQYRIFATADAGRLLAQLGRADAGRKLVEDAAAQAEKMTTSDEWNRYVRGFVAGRLASFDLPRAKKLLDGPTSAMERSRYAAMCANALAASDPDATAQMLELCEKGFYRDQHVQSAAYVMAATNPEAAVKLLDLGEGSSYTAAGYGWIALAVAPRDKPLAHRMIDRGFRAIHERNPKAKDWNSFGGWGEAAAALALFAVAVDHPDRAALAAHVIAERPTISDVSSEVRALEANIGLALLLAPADRAAARMLLDIAERRKQDIGGGQGGIRQREYLTAWALIDPQRSVSLLVAQIEKLKASGNGLNERSSVMDVLAIMTKTAGDRPRSIAKMLWTGWPDPEEIE